MATPDIVFDIVLFGALVVATLIDRKLPALSGGALLVVTGIWTYLSAMDLSDRLRQRRVRTHESLMTSLAIAVLGVVYYTTHWRAQLFSRSGENLVLLALSIALMMTALMAAIAVISMVADWHLSAVEYGLLIAWCAATVGGCYWLWTMRGLSSQAVLVATLSTVALVVAVCLSDPQRVRAVMGLLVTLGGATALGLTASYVILLAMPPQKPFLIFVLLFAAFAIGKAWMSLYLSPAEQLATTGDKSVPPVSGAPLPDSPNVVSADAKPSALAGAPNAFALPLRGRILPRFAAVLLLAPILFYLVAALSVER